jgi:RNA polymerase sigma-70 factor, ECF subfamily
MEAACSWDFIILMFDKTGMEPQDPDVKLMLRFKAGDVEAFNRLFSRYMRAMVNFACRFVHNREQAEELAQDIFLKMYEGAKGYTAQAKFTTWLYRIAANVCLNEVRKPHFRAVHQPLPEEHSDDPLHSSGELQVNPEPEKLLERQALAKALREALILIPENQRIAFILNKYQELSYSEVSDIMKISEKAVKSLIHRAKETLAERLASARAFIK